MKNTLTRREVLLSGLAAFSTFSALAHPSIKRFHISLQLYSVRDEMKSDPFGTLMKISGMGYHEVEPASYVDRKIYGYSATEFKKILEEFGLKCFTSHTGFKKEHWNKMQNDVTDDYKKTIEDALITGQKIMIVPSFDWDKKDMEEVKKGIEAFNRMSEIASESGLKIGFHNHHEEFEIMYNGEYLYDLMLKEWGPSQISQQLDIANMSLAGVDPMVFLRKYPHHYASIHVKDFNKKTKLSTQLGEGDLDIEAILAFAKKNTLIEYWVIEQEDYDGKMPLDAVGANLQRFKRYGFI